MGKIHLIHINIYCSELRLCFYNDYYSTNEEYLRGRIRKMSNTIPVTDLLNLSNYLVSLFLEIKFPIECPPVKIQKLILILQIYYKKHFNINCATDIENIAFAPCGFKIPDVVYYAPGYVNNSNANIKDKIGLSKEEKDHLLKCKKNLVVNPLFDPNNLDVAIKLILIEIFNRFAGYSADDLGEFLNGVKPKDKILKYGKISIDEFNSWILDDSIFEEIDERIKEFISEYKFGD